MIHLSIDDFLFTFKDLTENQEKYKSLFDQPIFGFFRNLHEAYGAAFSCYCFGEDTDTGFSLADVSRNYRKEFEENAYWLKFGFHGLNSEAVYGDNGGTRQINRSAAQAAEDYAYIVGQLVEVVGAGAIDKVPRIHFFAGTKECCMAWRDAAYGIEGLLAADDDRYSYYHDENMRRRLLQEDVLRDEECGLTFYRTHIRLEKEADVKVLWEKIRSFAGKCQVIFTHEYYLEDSRMLEKIELCAKEAAKRKCRKTYDI